MMKPTVILVLTACLGALTAQQQPRDVASAPAQLAANGRIAPADEPGTPLVISGIVVAADGKTPLQGAVVYAYHTDAKGYYRPNEAPGPSGEGEPRLKGWVRTGADGRFEFLTIKPAPYPRGEVPAHVHIHAWSAGYPRQWFMLEFVGDPLLPKQHFTDNTAEYLYVAPVMRDNKGVWHCSFTLRMREKTNFP